MARLARYGGAAVPPGTFGVAGEGGAGAPKDDSPLVRVAKYIPAESVAFFLGVKNLIEQSKPAAVPVGGPWPQGELLMNVCTVIAFIGTFFYLRSQRDKNQPWLVNALVATLAFPIWAYALDRQFGWFTPTNKLIAGIALLAYTFLAGLVKPIR